MERVCFVFFIARMQNFQASWYEYSRRPPQVRTARPDEGIFIRTRLYFRFCRPAAGQARPRGRGGVAVGRAGPLWRGVHKKTDKDTRQNDIDKKAN